MATKIHTASTSDNPGLKLESTGDRDRLAKRGLIGEWDMLTLVGTQLTDLSGNGNHFTFSATPTTDAEGWVADGVIYADMTLAAPLVTDYSIAIVYKASGTGYYIFGNANSGVTAGVGIRMHSQQRFVGPATNEAYVAGGTGWKGMLATVEQNQGRFRNLSDGHLNTANMLVVFNAAILAAMPATWRIGGVGAGGALAQPAPAGAKVSYLMMFDTIKDFRESACLSEYIKEKMTARGITYT